MADSARERSAPDLEHLAKQAKRLLRRCRDRDPEALAWVRAQLPGTRASSDATLALDLKLADVQHALAREHGHASWAELKRHLEAQEPIEAQVELFLEAERDRALPRARRLLARHPEIPRRSFHAACAVGDAETVAAWLRREPGAATAPHGEPAWPPLLYLCQSTFHSLGPRHAEESRRCAELLLDHGADPNTYMLFDAGDPESRIPALYFACVSDNVGVVRLLLERSAGPNDGESVYHAAELNHRRCLELLLAHGADISNPHHHWGNTPLYFLSGFKEQDRGATDVVEGMRWLLEHGADPNVPSDPSGETPLHRLADFGRDAAVVELILSHGADPTLRRKDGQTAYVLAVRAGNVAVADLLRQRGGAVGELSPADAFIGACARSDGLEARRILAQDPGLLESLGREERGALARAAEEGRTEAVRLMVELGFDLRWEGSWCGTALHHAAWRGNVAMTRLLLEFGAPVNVRDSEFGSSPLGWAAHGSTNCRKADDDYCAVVAALLAAGSDRETSINRWSEPPESMASSRVANLLRERGFAPAS